MKRILMMCCAAAAMLAGAVSCEEPETGYEGTNYIYLSAESNSMFDLDNASIIVNVTLTTALDQNLTLTLAMEENDYVELNGNPVTIPAGSTAASFTVDVTKQLPESEIEKNFTIALDNSTVLPENVVWNNDFTFTLMSSYVPELTDEQKEAIKTYRQALRDLPEQAGFPFVSFPELPSCIAYEAQQKIDSRNQQNGGLQ